MSDKVCPNGHVYKGNRCVRDNWEEPVEDVKPVETPDTSVKPSNEDISVEETPKVEKVKKAFKKVKKVAKKGKKK